MQPSTPNTSYDAPPAADVAFSSRLGHPVVTDAPRSPRRLTPDLCSEAYRAEPLSSGSPLQHRHPEDLRMASSPPPPTGGFSGWRHGEPSGSPDGRTRLGRVPPWCFNVLAAFLIATIPVVVHRLFDASGSPASPSVPSVAATSTSQAAASASASPTSALLLAPPASTTPLAPPASAIPLAAGRSTSRPTPSAHGLAPATTPAPGPRLSTPQSMPSPSASSVASGMVTFKDLATSFCLDGDTLGHVFTDDCNGSNLQRWIVDSGTSTLRNSVTGLCLDSNTSGAVSALACDAASSQMWILGSGATTVQNQVTRFCLDSNTAGNVYTLGCNEGSFQKWIVAG